MADEVKSYIRVKNEEEQQTQFLAKLDAIKNAISSGGGGGGGGFSYELITDTMATETQLTGNTWNNFNSNILLQPNKLYMITICATFNSYSTSRAVTLRSGIHTDIRQSVDISTVDSKLVSAQIIDYVTVDEETTLNCEIYPVQYNNYKVKNIIYNVLQIG